MRATAILETVLYAEDPQSCAAFYTRHFGLTELRAVPGRFNFLRCGTQMLLIFAPGPASDPDQQGEIPAHGARGPGHICFRAETAAELAAWRNALTEAHIPIEHEHRWPGGGHSLYLRDPAGNSVEIAEARIWGL
jgi:catechol 2,3-dioxygenase-like lactoylglutathione lyase family enzyme